MTSDAPDSVPESGSVSGPGSVSASVTTADPAHPTLSAEVIACALGQPAPTEEQIKVIEAPFAPALVVAGAGSGKTETMAGRVVWLVANGLVRRDQVLGLTFTRKAAGELSERVQRRLQRLAEFERHGLLQALPELYAQGRLAPFEALQSGATAEGSRQNLLAVLAAERASVRRSDTARTSATMVQHGVGVSGTPLHAPSSDEAAEGEAVPTGETASAGEAAAGAAVSAGEALSAGEAVPAGQEEAPAAATRGMRGSGDLANDVADELLQRPTIATYNSFADQIVREHAVLIGRDAESVMLTESAAWLLMRKVVFASDDDRLVQRDDAVNSVIDGALRIARDSVDNLADLDDLTQFAEDFSDVLSRKSEKKSVDVYADVRSAEAKVSGLPVLVRLAREYNAAKSRLGVMDFADQVAGALRVVRENPTVGAELRERFRVVLLDEYQDTSVVQTDLLAALFADTAVMAVGDPHQSIYGWRGASAGNLGDFAGAFAASRAARTFRLMTSWRNSTRVLDAANALLADLPAAVSVGKLRARPHAPDGQVEFSFDNDIDTEAERVAEWFHQVRSERAARGEKATGAVLFRSKRHMVLFGDALGRRGIPHRILGLGGLLSTPEVVDVIAALRVISDPTAGSALIRLLNGPRWRVGLVDIRALEQLARRLTRHDHALQPIDSAIAAQLRSGPDQASLIDALDFMIRVPDDHGWLDAFTPHARARLREAASVFAELRAAASVPIPELIRLIEHELRLDIELAANETRGPARIASAQLRAFIDEIHVFLAADESGSVSSLLAWLDHAERLDEFAPRTEPPEEDVVQLLTIHGSKGLEWDAVAVVRMVEDELPARVRSKLGWLSFGVLPYAFRGDARWLPHLKWRREQAPTQQDLQAEFQSFYSEIKTKALQEDQRLAYVAVTRAREHLLLSGASWSGTKSARQYSPFYRSIATAMGNELAERDPGENPFVDRRRTLSWPMNPLGTREGVVSRAAEDVRAALTGPSPEPERDIALLLAERDAAQVGAAGRAPTRIAASRYKDFVADYDGAVAAIARPMPERPFRQTRLGTLFHAWVEQRAQLPGRWRSLEDALWEIDDDEGGGSSVDQYELAQLQETFLASPWADRQPIEVETEIDFTDTDLDGTEHVVICKLDAVYQGEQGRIEIVDWKTGAPPRNERERKERMVQLELYRRAYHHKHRVPLANIDVVLYYVADNVILRG